MRHGGTGSVGPRHEYSFKRTGQDRRLKTGTKRHKKRINELYGNQRFKKRHFAFRVLFNMKENV